MRLNFLGFKCVCNEQANMTRLILKICIIYITWLVFCYIVDLSQANQQ